MDLQVLNQILLSIYPAAAVSSQSLLDLSLALLFLSLIFCFKKNRADYVFQKIGVEWAFLGYVIVVVLGFWLNASPDAEWKVSAIKFSWLLNIYILIFGLQSVQLNSKRVIKILSALTLGPTLYSLISYIHGVDLITGRDNDRITGLVNSSTYHAHGNAVIFVFLVACLYFSRKKLTKFWQIFSLISVSLLGVSIFLTFTRGIWLSVFVSSACMLWFLNWRKLTKFLLSTAVIFILGLLVWPKFNERVVDKSNLKYNNERVSLFKVNVQIWKEYPLLGIGYGENMRRNREYWDRPEWNKPPGYLTSHAHNQFLNVLATTGIFGFIFFCSFFFYFFVKNISLLGQTSSDSTPERWTILIACMWAQIEYLVACFTDVGFEYTKIRALILIVWALVVVLEQKSGVIKEDHRV